MALRMDINGEMFHGKVKLNGEVSAPKNSSWAGRTLKFNNTVVDCDKTPRVDMETVVCDQLKIKIADRLRKLPYEKAKVLITQGFKFGFVHAKIVQTRSPAEVMGDARRAYNDAAEGSADKKAKEEYFRTLVKDMAQGLGVEPQAIAPDLKW